MNLGIYLLRRTLALLPTLLGISLVAFLIINLAPGGPVEQALLKIRYAGNMSGGGGASATKGGFDSAVSEEVVASLKRQYGFDKPLLQRYAIWLGNLVRLDFGDSFIHHRPVIDVLKDKMPVSLLFGLVSFLLTYLVCVPLGIVKAVWNGSRFDTASSFAIFFTHSLPAFMLAILMIVWLGPGGLDWFPIQGLVSQDYHELGFVERLMDRISHAFMPLFCYCIGNFAVLTMLMKNTMLDVIEQDYVRTARAKGLGERQVILKHVLRNAMIPIATGLGSFLTVFFAGSLLIEQIFNLDGLGLLGYQAVLQRDYNVIMGTLMISSFLALFGQILSDIAYVLIDPRIDFSEASEG